MKAKSANYRDRPDLKPEEDMGEVKSTRSLI